MCNKLMITMLFSVTGLWACEAAKVELTDIDDSEEGSSEIGDSADPDDLD